MFQRDVRTTVTVAAGPLHELGVVGGVGAALLRHRLPEEARAEDLRRRGRDEVAARDRLDDRPPRTRLIVSTIE